MRLRLLSAAALIACAALSGCTASGGDSPGAWTVELSTAPTLLALSDEQVFAASYGNGVGGSQVYRVDRSAGRLAAQRTVAGQPNGLALAPDGEVWLATLQLPDQPTGTGLQVLDPTTLQTRRTVKVEAVPLSLAFVGGALWVGDAAGVREVDPRTGVVLRSVPTAVKPYRLVEAGRALVVVGPQGLQRVDPATGAASAPRPVPAGGSITATGDRRRLWLVHPDGRGAAVLQRYDVVSLQPGLLVTSPGAAGAAALLAGDRLWVTDPGRGRLLCADAASGQVRGERRLSLTGPLVADGSAVVAAQSRGLTAVPAACGAAD